MTTVTQAISDPSARAYLSRSVPADLIREMIAVEQQHAAVAAQRDDR